MSPSDTPSRSRSILIGSHKWSRRLVTAVLLLVGLALLGIGVLWTAGGDVIAEKATALLNSQIFDERTRIAIGDVAGFPFHRVRIDGVDLTRQGPEDWYSFAALGEIEFTYDLWGILHGRYVASRVEADGLRLEFRNGEGGVLIPTTRGSGDGKSGGGLPAFRIRTLVIRDGSLLFELPFRTVELDSVFGELSVESDRQGLAFTVKHLVGTGGDGVGRLELDQGTFRVGESVELLDFAGRWDGSPFTVDGPVTPAVDLAIGIETFPLERLGRFIDEEALEPGYLEHLQGTLSNADGPLTFQWDGAGRWEEWALDRISGRGRLANDVLRLSDVRAGIEGASLTDVTVTVPIDRNSLTLNGNFEDLHTRTPRVEFLNDYPGLVSGTATITLNDRSDLLGNTDARIQLGPGHLLEVPFVSGAIDARIRGGAWSFDSLQVNLAQATVRGRGQVGLETLDLTFGYRGDLKPWRQFLAQDELEGTGQLQVRLLGDLQQPDLSAAGWIQNLKIATITSPEVDLESAQGTVTNPRNLALVFKAPHGVAISGTAFSGASGRLEVTEDRVIMDGLHLTRGDTTLTVAGDLQWEPTIRIHVLSAEAKLGERRFWIDGPGDLAYDADVLSSPGLTARTPRGAVAVKGDWNMKTNTVNMVLGLQGLDPSVFIPAESLPPVAIGKINGKLELVGTIPDLEGSGDLGLREIDWEGAQAGHLDSVAVRFEVREGRVDLHHLEAIRRPGRVLIEGRISLPTSVYGALTAIRDGGAPDPQTTRWDLTARATDIDLAAWRFLIPRRERAAGRIDLTGSLSGTSALPELTVDGSAWGLAFRGFEADTVRLAALASGGTIQVSNLRIHQKSRRMTVTGSVPADWTLLPFSASLPERELDLQIAAEEGSLENLKLTPWVKKATDNLQASIHVGGTPDHPRLNGQARIDDGYAELKERDEVVKHVTARIRFVDDQVFVDEAKGLVGVKWSDPDAVGGWATAQGNYRLGAVQEDTYELKVHLEKCVVGQEGEYAAQVTGDLVLVPRRAPDQKIYPYATGDLFVHRAEYAGSLQPQDIGEFKPPSILYEVNLDAPSKIFIRADDVDAELGGENLIVRQRIERQEILGTLEILRGNYEFFQKIFRVREGELNWDDPSTKLPTMDIIAETREGGYLITVHLTGRVGEPNLVFSAQSGTGDANLSQDEILRILMVGAVGLSAGQDGSSIGSSGVESAAGAAARLFTDDLERRLQREIGLVDELNLETGTESGQLEVGVEARKYVSPYLSIQVGQVLTGDYRQSIAVEYRLRRKLYLRGGMTTRDDHGSPLQEYNLDLKIRHEY